jgi:hypothetical protein
MRCPKCGYISFDLVEKCVKCRKNISGAAVELQGTVASVPPPVFLSPDYSSREAGQREEGEAEPQAEQHFDLIDEEEVFVDFSAEEEPAAEAETPVEETAMDISDLSPAEKEPAPFDEIGAEEVAVAIGDEKPFTSDEAGQGLEDLKVEGIDLNASPAPPSDSAAVSPVKTGTALDDFDVDLDEVFGKK